MTDKEILETAIDKAAANGWTVFGLLDNRRVFEEYTNPFTGKQEIEIKFVDAKGVVYYTVNDVIFDQEFARALWGEVGKTVEGLQTGHIEGTLSYWAYRLQQMVIHPEPLKYLRDNMP